jgi:hypothetical protein
MLAKTLPFSKSNYICVKLSHMNPQTIIEQAWENRAVTRRNNN